MSDWFRVPNRKDPHLRRGHFGDVTPNIRSVSPSRGLLAGVAVTITGSNFHKETDGSVPIVTFGGVAATNVVVVDPNTITAVVPAASVVGQVDVVVTSGTQSATLVSGFTYYQPTIVSASPEHGPISGGTEITILGYNFDRTATYDVLFGDAFGLDVEVVDEQTIFATSPNHAVGRVDLVLLVGITEHARLRNGFQFTLLTRGEDIRRQPGISIRDVLNNAPNSATFRVDGFSNTPLVGEKIEILDSQDGDRRLFAGNVQSVQQIYEDDTVNLAFDTVAQDFTWLLNKYRPFGVYKNVSVSSIVKDLVARFAPFFTTNHVQTKLARVSITFDGRDDFSTCLNQLAQAIGGGHWYGDYDQDLHFFHRLPNSIIIPQTSGPISAMTVAEGAAVPGLSFPVGWYLFRSTNVYDNGVESALGPYSNAVAMQGNKKFTFTNVPVGATIGSHTVAKRRIYMTFVGQDTLTQLARFVEINDNVTTTFSTNYLADGATVGTVLELAATTPFPIVNRTVPPIAPTSAPIAAASASTIYRPAFPPFGSAAANAVGNITNGRWAFKVSYIYRDGSESLPSISTNSVTLNGSTGVDLASIPLGPTIDGNDVVARKIYASYGLITQKSLASVVAALRASQAAGTLASDWSSIIGISDSNYLQGVTIPDTYFDLAMIIGFGDLDYLLSAFEEPTWSPDRTSMWFLINDNTTTSVTIGPGMGAGQPVADGTSSDIPSWPNADGPNLEDVDPPVDLDDDNPYILKDPPFTLEKDQSQIRNRVYVVGAGSSLSAKAVAGTASLQVGDVSIYAQQGGKLLVGGYRLVYTSLSSVTGEGLLYLNAALSVDIEQGTPVNLFFQADDEASQRDRAKVELDTNGLPTDGVHEFTIVDTSLSTPFQLYMRAYAELELFAWPIQTVRYATRDPKTKSGQIVHIDQTNPPCIGDFLIQEVTIDQIHDESDQLMPRYSVVASSVKFELEDLLLSLLGGNNNSNRLSGISTGSIDSLLQNAAATDIPTKKRFTYETNWTAYMDNAGGLSGLTNNAEAPGSTAAMGSAGGAVSHVDATDGPWSRSFTTGATGADNTGMTSPGLPSAGGCLFARVSHNPFFEIRIKTRPSFAALTAHKFYCGFFTGILTVPTTATLATTVWFGMKCRWDAGDLSLFIAKGTGVIETIGGAVGSFLPTGADVVYRLRVWIDDGGTNFKCQVNDGVVVAMSLPVASTSGTFFNPTTSMRKPGAAVAAEYYASSFIASRNYA